MRNIKNLIIISILIFTSCKTINDKDYKKFTVVDFTKKRIDTLKPYDDKSYVSYFIKVKGDINDSIKIQRKGYYDIILSGKVDTLINGDYYGGNEMVLIFNPYLATKGRVEVEYGL